MGMQSTSGGIRVRVGEMTREFPPGRQVVIGRDPACDIVLESQYVSRQHALLTNEGGAWVLENRGQRGITFRGNQVSRLPISGPVECWLGDPSAGERLEIEPLGVVADATIVPVPPTATVVTPGGAMHRGDAGGIVVRLNGRESSFPEGKVILIGRAPGADVRSDNPTVSREHVRISQKGGAWVLESLGQLGTYRDGSPVTSQTIAGLTTFQIGDKDQADVLEVDPMSAAATQLPGGSMTRTRATVGQTSVVRRLTQSNRRTQVIAVIAAALAVILGVVAIVVASGNGESDVEGVIEVASPKTALIWVDGRHGGSGWVWNAERGFVVTNAHVTEGSQSFEVGVLAENRAADLLGVAPCDDLAVLQVSDATGLQEFALGSEDSLRVGQEVVTLGYPVTLADEPTLIADSGTISALQTAYPFQGYIDLIQHDSTVNPGNSGGPLVDLDGRLIGVNSLYNFQEIPGLQDSRPVLNQFYSIATSRIEAVGPVLTSGISMGADGIGPRRLLQLRASGPNIPSDMVLVADVESGSPAANAQILAPFDEQGLFIATSITNIDGVPIATPGDYCDAIRDKQEGDTAQYRLVDYVIVGEGISRLPETSRRATISF